MYISTTPKILGIFSALCFAVGACARTEVAIVTDEGGLPNIDDNVLPDGGTLTDEGGVTMTCASSRCEDPYATCPDSPDVCGTNLNTDILNCGACGNSCGLARYYSPRELDYVCVDGQCVLRCNPAAAGGGLRRFLGERLRGDARLRPQQLRRLRKKM